MCSALSASSPQIQHSGCFTDPDVCTSGSRVKLNPGPRVDLGFTLFYQGVVVLFVHFGAPRAENFLHDRHLQFLDLRSR